MSLRPHQSLGASPVFAAFGVAVSSPTPYLLIADVAATVLAAGLWLRFLNR